MGRTNSTSGQRGARNHKHSNLQQIISIFNKENTSKSNMPKGGGLTKPMKLSDDLAAIVGRKSASRAKCMKYLWAYLKKNNLQCEDNKQYFLPDKKWPKFLVLKNVEVLEWPNSLANIYLVLLPMLKKKRIPRRKTNLKISPKKASLQKASPQLKRSPRNKNLRMRSPSPTNLLSRRKRKKMMNKQTRFCKFLRVPASFYKFLHDYARNFKILYNTGDETIFFVKI